MTLTEASNVVGEAIEDAREYLPRLREGLAEIVSLMQGGNEGEAINLFIQAVDGLEWLGAVISGMEFLHGSVSNSNQEELAAKYSTILSDLLDAWKNEDKVLIGDLIEFELIPVVDSVLDSIY